MSNLLTTIRESVPEAKKEQKKYGTIQSFVDKLNVVVELVGGKTVPAVVPQQDEWSNLVYRIGDGVIVVGGVIVGKARSNTTLKVYRV